MAVNSELGEKIGSRYACRTVSAVKSNLVARKINILNRGNKMTCVIKRRHLGASDTSDISAYLNRRLSYAVKDNRFNFLLQFIGKLIAVRLKDFDAVVFARVM